MSNLYRDGGGVTINRLNTLKISLNIEKINISIKKHAYHFKVIPIPYVYFGMEWYFRLYCTKTPLVYIEFIWAFTCILQATDNNPSSKTNSILCVDCEGNGKRSIIPLMDVFLLLSQRSCILNSRSYLVFY